MPKTIYYLLGERDALMKIGMRTEARKKQLEAVGIKTQPMLRSKVRSENEPMVQATPWTPPATKNPFEDLDYMAEREIRRGTQKAAALGSVLKNISGAKPLNTPPGMGSLLKAPKPQMATGPRVNMPKVPGAIDPRANKPRGMNLQHQVQDDATTMDVASSMSSPQRRFVSPL